MASISAPLPKPVVKSSCLAPDVCAKAISCSLKAVSSNYSDKDVAASLRAEFQSLYADAGTWNCVVGRDMGCYVTHKEGCYIYLYVGHLGICLFAT